MLTARFYADHDIHLPEALKMAEEEYSTRKNVYQADTLAWCYFKNGRIEDARKMIRVALSHNTPESIFYFHKGMIEARAGNRAAAQLALYTASSMNPNYDVIATPIAEKTLVELGAHPVNEAAMANRSSN
jgi:Flp pilus assembly protein TadD